MAGEEGERHCHLVEDPVEGVEGVEGERCRLGEKPCLGGLTGEQGEERSLPVYPNVGWAGHRLDLLFEIHRLVLEAEGRGEDQLRTT